MNGYLKQSTASQVRTIGPFVDDTDFKTLETALTIANTDIKIKKNGGTAASKSSGGATADSTTGLYHLTWGTADTDTVGELSVSIKVSGALVYFCTYTVLTAAVYDMLFGASATGYISDTTRASQTSVDAIGTAVDTEVAAILAAVDTEVAAIKAKTDNLPASPAATGAAMTLTSAYDAAKTASSQTSVDAVKAVVDAIKVLEDHLATALELDGAVYRFTTNALEQAPTGTGGGTAPTAIEVADAVLTRDWTLVSSEAAYSTLNALRQLRNVWDTSGGVLHVYGEDGTTVKWTRVLGTDINAAPIISST